MKSKYATIQLAILSLALGLAAGSDAQVGSSAASKPSLFVAKPVAPQVPSFKPLQEGVGVRLKDITRFRGIRSNRLEGFGLVLGLNGTGDSKNVSATVTALANYMKQKHIDVDPTTLQVKNCALVQVTADLPPFAVNGQKLDVTVSSVGDAKSLRNGTLVMTELTAAGNTNVIYATAAGQISVGGFTEGGGGNAQSVGFVTVGRIPGGGVVEHEAPTTMVREGKISIELDTPDNTTAHRIESRVNEVAPEFHAVAIDGGTVQVDLPTNQSVNAAMAKLENITVQADTPTQIVVNERSGTIVMGGDVKLAPCAIATGSLSVKIESVTDVVQPNPLSNGTTAAVTNSKLTAGEDRAQIAVLKANTTIADLARIFQELKLKPADIINVLQMLHDQGALKARVVVE